MWLRDFLPRNFPDCRVLLYGYDSKVSGSKTDQRVEEIAGTCKNVLINFRKLTETESRPVIWLGQSMGGLIVQEVLIQSAHHRNPGDVSSLLERSKGFLGYGVPMNGLRNDSLLNFVKGQPNFEMIKSICLEDGRPSPYLKGLADRFDLCSKGLEVHHFCETNLSADRFDAEAAPQRRVDHPEMVGREKRYWVPRDHSELVKFSGRNDEVYRITKDVLALMMQKIQCSERCRMRTGTKYGALKP
ncbi:hypothetical protein GGR56DRAFT_668423 [Xylariaceae sp. FL0804]|nr:hypothetical protein GGR56DRAFT_668423 [Xylariaceae sp. FL0804]